MSEINYPATDLWDNRQESDGLELEDGVIRIEPAIPDSGVSRWTFDDADTDNGTAIDSWGENDAIINGATTGVSGANESYDTNEAYSFDGSGDYVDLSVGVTGAGAISFWLAPDNSAGTIQENFSGARNSGGDEDFLILQSWDDGSTYWGFRIADTQYRITVNDSYPSGYFHVVFTWDDSTGEYTLYWDGGEKGSGSDLPSVAGISPSLYVGASNTGGSPVNHAGCDIDDPRLYDKMLTSNEVSNLYNTGSVDG